MNHDDVNRMEVIFYTFTVLFSSLNLFYTNLLECTSFFVVNILCF